MKTLHRSRLLADVVRQRQEQLAQRAQHAAAVRAAEAAFLDCQRQQVHVRQLSTNSLQTLSSTSTD